MAHKDYNFFERVKLIYYIVYKRRLSVEEVAIYYLVNRDKFEF